MKAEVGNEQIARYADADLDLIGKGYAMKTVLVADDEVYIRLILDINLKAKNLDVVTCRDGQEAFEAAIRVMPDLVVTDLQMPFMDGLQLAQALHQLPETAPIPILMLTARGHLLSDSERQNTNIHAIMEKPFSPREFMRRVEDLLGMESDRDDDDVAGPPECNAA